MTDNNIKYEIHFFNEQEWVKSFFSAENEQEAIEKVKFLNEGVVKYRYVITGLI